VAYLYRMQTLRRILAPLLSALLVLQAVPQAVYAQVKLAPAVVRTAPVGGIGAVGGATRVVPRLPSVTLGNMTLGALTPALNSPQQLVANPLLNAAPQNLSGATLSGPAINAARPVQHLLPRSVVPLRPRIPGLIEGAQNSKAKGATSGRAAKTTTEALRFTAAKIKKGQAQQFTLDALYDSSGKAAVNDAAPADAGWGALATRPSTGLRYAASDAQQNGTFNIGSGARAVLRSPAGEELQVQVVRTVAQQEAALEHRTELPQQGVLTAGQDVADFDIWVKNQLVPLDFVVLDDKGLVTAIFESVGPVRPETHWSKIPVLKAAGQHLLSLPVGGISRYDARVGAAFSMISAKQAVVAEQSPAQLAARVLTGEESEIRAVAEGFTGQARDDDRFEETLRELKAAGKDGRGATRDFVRHIWGATETQGAYEGILSRVFPGEFFRRFAHPMRAWALPARLLMNFFTAVHETGHALMARALGVPVERVRVFWTGSGYVRLDMAGTSRWQRVLISFAGIALEVGVAALMVALPFAVGAHGMLLTAAANAGTPEALPLLYTALATISAASLALMRMIFAPIGAHFDFVSALSDMGFKRFAFEWGWRERLRRSGRLGRWGYYRTLLSMLWPWQIKATGDRSAHEEGGLTVLGMGAQASGRNEKRVAGTKLARRLQMDFGLDDALRDDLEGLLDIVSRMPVKDPRMYPGLDPVRRARMTRFFQWLRQQLESEGNLPLFERTRSLASSGYYDEATGLSLLNIRRNGARHERLATLAHEAYHRWANINNMPMARGGRLVQEDDALIVELLLWNQIEQTPRGSARLQGRMAEVLNDMRAGSANAAVAAFVDDMYGGHLDSLRDQPLTADLRRELSERRDELVGFRSAAAKLKKRDKERAEQILERRIAALNDLLK
jgi:uncharacterized membrane protein (UPF0127 family)